DRGEDAGPRPPFCGHNAQQPGGVVESAGMNRPSHFTSARWPLTRKCTVLITRRS
ncbi:unnamed protein product, partial [Pylaiella littoralis]